VKKTRNTAKSTLEPSKPADKLCRPVVQKRSLKSILTPKSSVAEDYTHIPAFLGRYRTPSSPELRGAQTSNHPCRSQSLSRASSFSSLRHLPPDKERTLYIGIKNHRLLLPSRSNRSSNPVVTYRRPLHQEKKTPSMTPYAIIRPIHSDKVLITMLPTTSTGAQPTSERGSAIVIRRSSSDISIAGSIDSSDTDLTVSSPRISSSPPSSKYGQTMRSILLQARLITYHSSLKF
jgi:hypothetical protein